MSPNLRQGLGVIALLTLVAFAVAQTGRYLPKLEPMVAPADRVFRGTILRREQTPIKWEFGTGLRHTLTIRVDENIKGKGEGTVILQFDAQSDSPYWWNWIDPKKSYLWFVGPEDNDRWGSMITATRHLSSEHRSPHWLLLDLDAFSNEDHASQGRFQLPIFGSDLNVVKTRRDALDRVRAFAKAHPRPVPVLDTTLPSDYVRRNGVDPNAYLAITLPKVAAEPYARRLIDHTADFYDKPNEKGMILTRLSGIRLLSHFKAETNVRLLKRLLKDPALWRADDQYDDRDNAYLVRQAAYDLLRSWNVSVPEPILKATPRP